MPRFFLHVHDDVDSIDKEGIDLPNLVAAYAEALAGLRGIMAHEVQDGRLPTHMHVTIMDEGGAELGVVRFLDAIEVLPVTSKFSFATY